MSVPPTAWADLPFGPGVRLVAAHPCGLAVLEKPAGVRSHPNDRRPDRQALLTTEYDQGSESFLWGAAAEGGTRSVFLLNRLDSPTSGLIAVACHSAVAVAVRALFAARQVEKVYQAIVRGRPVSSRETWTDSFGVDRKGGVLRSGCGRGSGKALTEVRLVDSRKRALVLSRLELRPRTGLTHQLRVQCANRGLPIIGDGTYGDFRLNRELLRRPRVNRLYLHAQILRIPVPGGGRGEFLEAESPLPEAFADLLNSA